MSIKIITWNVNGIRSRVFNDRSSTKIKKDSNIIPEDNSSMMNLLKYNADIICLQETRIDSIDSNNINLNKQYYKYFNSSKLDGARGPNRYSGTAVYTKIIPNKIQYSIEGYDIEDGRIIILYFDKFIVINVYTPNSGTNFENRLIWQEAFLKFLNNLQDKLIIFCGDMNVAYRPDDIHFNYKNSSTFKKNTDGIVGYLPEERDFISKLLKLNYKDSYLEVNKCLYKDPIDFKGFTWWDPRSKKINNEETGIDIGIMRYKNIGWRIDYIFIKGDIKLLDSKVLKNIGEEYSPQGSDHAPLLTEFLIIN